MSSDISIASKRPAFLDNKCLVVSRISKSTSITLLQAYVNQRADRYVKFLYEPKNVSREYAKWHTIAIELNNTDYELLSKPEFSDSDIRLKDHIGRRFWRDQASNMSANDRLNSVRQSWEPQP